MRLRMKNSFETKFIAQKKVWSIMFPCDGGWRIRVCGGHCRCCCCCRRSWKSVITLTRFLLLMFPISSILHRIMILHILYTLFSLSPLRSQHLLSIIVCVCVLRCRRRRRRSIDGADNDSKMIFDKNVVVSRRFTKKELKKE